MPLNAKRVTDRVVPVPFDLVLRNEETGEVEVEKVVPKVKSLSYSRWRQAFALVADQSDTDVMARQLNLVVEDLDMVIDGQPFPPTIDNLQTIDTAVLDQYSKAIQDFFMPALPSENGKKTATSDGSAATES